MRGENLSLRDFLDYAIVAPAPHFKVRRKQNIEFQLRKKVFVSFESAVDEHRVLVRITDDFFDDAVAPFRVRICDAEAEGVVRDTLDLGSEVTPLFMDERLTVSDQKLKVTNLRAVDGRIVLDLLSNTAVYV